MHDPCRCQPIAIVGIHVEIPSGSYSENNLNHHEFFQFLLDKKESYIKVPVERFDIDAWQGHGPGQIYPQLGSFLKDISLFDALEFGISSKDARSMALGTRKLLENAFLALLDSGIDYRGRRVGCFTSAVAFDINNIAEPDVYENRGSYAGIPAMVANRVSYHLDLLGPSVPTDTACSSTLTALHLAIQAVRSKDCEAAVVGGAQVNHRLLDFVQASQGSVLSPDGKCKPFDASANGFSRAEGVAAIVIKPLDDAIRDGDHIYGTILGTGINSSGSAAPVNAPVAEAQADAMRQAYSHSGCRPSEADYVEMHATGTAVGDPTEANWVGQEFQRDGPIFTGSVKGNVGHLEIVAFFASLSKVCSMFATGLIPPAVNLYKPNPAIEWSKYHLTVSTEIAPLQARRTNQIPLVSINSSGIGGANGHCVIEGPPRRDNTRTKIGSDSTMPRLFIAAGLSPRSATAIAETISKLAKEGTHDLASLSLTYGRRSKQMNWKTFFLASPGSEPTPSDAPIFSPRSKPPLVFAFSGQGPQHILMGQQLMIYPAFKSSILRSDAVYKAVTGQSLIETTGLFIGCAPTEPLPEVWSIAIILPALAMVQMALFDLLCCLGLTPDIVMGHSAGETALLYGSGAGCQSMAMELAIARGRAIALTESLGATMMALSSTPADAKVIIDSIPLVEGLPKLEIACYNAHDAVTLAGYEVYIDQALSIAKSKGFFGRKIRTKVPVHSSFMMACQSEFKQSVEDIFSRYPGSHFPKVKMYSSVTGAIWTEELTAQYYWNGTIMPVQFAHSMSTMLQSSPNAVIVEISPHPVLTMYITSLGAPSSSITCPMHRSKSLRPYDEIRTLLTSLGSLAVHGLNLINFHELNGVSIYETQKNLPPYPFSRRSISYYPEILGPSSIVARHHRKKNGPLNFSEMRITSETHPLLSQHVVRNEQIMPAAGFIEMSLEFGAKSLTNIDFRSFLPLSPQQAALRVAVTVDNDHWVVSSTIPSPNLSTPVTRINCDGYMSYEYIKGGLEMLDILAIRNRCNTTISQNDFYDTFSYFVNHGPVFRRVTECYLGVDEGLAEIRGLSSDLLGERDYVIHPAILDACLQLAGHPAFTASKDPNVYYLPSRLRSFWLHEEGLVDGSFPDAVFSYTIFREWAPNGITADVIVCNEDGLLLCTINGFQLAKNYINIMPEPTAMLDMVYQPWATCLSEYSVADVQMLLDDPGNQSIPSNLKTSQYYANHLHRLLQFLSSVRKKHVIRVLDINTGDSVESHALQQVFQELPGVIVEHVVAITRPNISGAFPANIRLRSYDLQSPTSDPLLAKVSFDLVICSDASKYQGSWWRALQQISSLLLPGGFILININQLDLSLPHDSKDELSGMYEGYTIDSRLQWIQLFGASNVLARSSEDDSSLAAQPVASIAQKTSFIPLVPVQTAGQFVEPVFAFRLGHEMDLKEKLATTPEVILGRIWIYGETPADAAAARGFSRSIRKEMANDIRFVEFDESWTFDQYIPLLSRLSILPFVEDDIFIDRHGDILVPKLVPGPPIPSNIVSFDPILPWISPVEGVVQFEIPSPPSSYVVVNVTYGLNTNGKSWPFSGVVTQQGASSSWPVGSLVMGMTNGPLSNYICIHDLSIFSIPEGVLHSACPVFVLGSFILSLAIGFKTICRAERLKVRRILVTNSNTLIGQCILHTLSILGVPADSVVDVPLNLDVNFMRGKDLILTEAFEDRKEVYLRSVADSTAGIFTWANWDTIPSIVLRNPYYMSDLLEDLHYALKGATIPHDALLLSSAPANLLPPHPNVILSSIFSSNKAYLLIGGIGSLGLSTALWMYQNGARHLVLTSRSGRKSASKNTTTSRILRYLEARKDLHLRIESCDAASSRDMSPLIASISLPIGGCILLSAVLADALYVTQTKESFATVMRPKVEAFRVLESVLDIEKMDFLITLSSITLFGNAGQTNYSSANTAVDELTRKYPNAFAMIAPAILDSSMITGTDDVKPDSRFDALLTWAVSTERICTWLGDGIKRLRTRPFWLYVPELEWAVVEAFFGASPIFRHLVQDDLKNTTQTDAGHSLGSLQELVLHFLDVELDDFDSSIPFTSYGLDSLLAGKLSFALKPVLNITQLQLLADISLDDLQKRIEDQSSHQGASEANQLPKQFSWDALNQPGETIVKLVEGDNIPLILIHDASGSIVPFMELQQRFNTALWAIQTTPETPVDSIQDTARFYYMQIKKALLNGPYRLGFFSATSVLGFAVLRHFEQNGDQVVQFVQLDHFPLIFCSPVFRLDEKTVNNRVASRHMLGQVVKHLCDCYRRDRSVKRHELARELEDAYQGLPVGDYIKEYMRMMERYTESITQFLLDLISGPGKGSLDKELRDWVKSCCQRSPLTMYIATRGMGPSLPELRGAEWVNLGVHTCFPDAKIVTIETGHFDMLENEVAIDHLQREWLIR